MQNSNSPHELNEFTETMLLYRSTCVKSRRWRWRRLYKGPELDVVGFTACSMYIYRSKRDELDVHPTSNVIAEAVALLMKIFKPLIAMVLFSTFALPPSRLQAQTCTNCYFCNDWYSYGYPGMCDGQAADCDYHIRNCYCENGNQLSSTERTCTYETPSGFGGCYVVDAGCS